MKNIYIVGGTMGGGKTATCNALKHKLDNAVFLDGDWCWDADPFQVTDETSFGYYGYGSSEKDCHVIKWNCKAALGTKANSVRGVKDAKDIIFKGKRMRTALT